jgi:hypothetical protein
MGIPGRFAIFGMMIRIDFYVFEMGVLKISQPSNRFLNHPDLRCIMM